MRLIFFTAIILFYIHGNRKESHLVKNENGMKPYVISEECRHYLDAILPTFKYDRIADIRGSLEAIIVAEKANKSKGNIYILSLKIKEFLEKNKFGHSVDYVFNNR